MPDELQAGITEIIKERLDVKYLKGGVVLEILAFLDSKDVVKKVPGAMPGLQSRLTDKANADLLLKQGWSKTERLIKE